MADLKGDEDRVIESIRSNGVLTAAITNEEIDSIKFLGIYTVLHGTSCNRAVVEAAFQKLRQLHRQQSQLSGPAAPIDDEAEEKIEEDCYRKMNENNFNKTPYKDPLGYIKDVVDKLHVCIGRSLNEYHNCTTFVQTSGIGKSRAVEQVARYVQFSVYSNLGESKTAYPRPHADSRIYLTRQVPAYTVKKYVAKYVAYLDAWLQTLNAWRKKHPELGPSDWWDYHGSKHTEVIGVADGLLAASVGTAGSGSKMAASSSSAPSSSSSSASRVKIRSATAAAAAAASSAAASSAASSAAAAAAASSAASSAASTPPSSSDVKDIDPSSTILFFFDEARCLLKHELASGSMTYFQALRRALNQPQFKGRIFAIFTDTSSALSNFAPTDETDPSHRPGGDNYSLQDPIYLLPTIDIFAPQETPKDLASAVSLDRLCKLSRPLLGLLEKTTAIAEAGRKLLNGQRAVPEHDCVLHLLACWGSWVSLAIPVQSRIAEKLVSSHGATLLSVSPKRDRVLVGYPSEPPLSLAAMRILSEQKDWGLDAVVESLANGEVSPGPAGELAVRCLIVLSMAFALKAANPTVSPALSFKTLPLSDVLPRLIGRAADIVLERWNEPRLADAQVAISHVATLLEAPTRTMVVELGKRSAAIQCPRNQKGSDHFVPIQLGVTDESPQIPEDSVLLLQVRNYAQKRPRGWEKAATQLLTLQHVFGEEEARRWGSIPYISLLIQVGEKASSEFDADSDVWVSQLPEKTDIGTEATPVVQKQYSAAVFGLQVCECPPEEKENEYPSVGLPRSLVGKLRQLRDAYPNPITGLGKRNNTREVLFVRKMLPGVVNGSVTEEVERKAAREEEGRKVTQEKHAAESKKRKEPQAQAGEKPKRAKISERV